MNKFCRHFSGIWPFNADACPCRLGEDVFSSACSDQSSGWVMRLPCNSGNSINQCPRFENLRAEEVSAIEKKRAITKERTNKILPVILEIKRTRKPGSAGMMRCPACGQALNWSMHYINGHMRAQCSTENCFSMME